MNYDRSRSNYCLSLVQGPAFLIAYAYLRVGAMHNIGPAVEVIGVHRFHSRPSHDMKFLSLNR